MHPGVATRNVIFSIHRRSVFGSVLSSLMTILLGTFATDGDSDSD